MTPTITAFAMSPDKGRGLARDMPVRWALEEIGLSYAVRLLSFDELRQREHLSRQPFGQIPTYEEEGLVLFESGAIVHHIAGRGRGLLPVEPNARARAVSWMFAAASSVEPAVVEREQARFTENDRTWFDERQGLLDERVKARLAPLSRALADKNWLDVDFSAGDLMMVTVLRRLKSSTLLDDYPNLGAFIARAEDRPAFKRAFAAQLAVFEGAAR